MKLQKGLKLLDSLIQENEETIEIAELQIMQNIHNTGNAGSPYKGWPREKYEAEKSLQVLKAIKEGFMESLEEVKRTSAKTTKLKVPNKYPGVGDSYSELCWTNYRCMLLWNSDTFMIDPIFWTPDLGIDNSHYALRRYANTFKNKEGHLLYGFDYRWGGFYTYGLGNGDQKQLTLYGESSDYPHDEWSEKVKQAFLKGEQFIPEIEEEDVLSLFS